MDTFFLAKTIVAKLVQTGHIAYFAGGWVRDYLMQKESIDIDIATSATSKQIMEIFPYTIPVGINFGIIIVVLEGHQFEVATFRKDLTYLDGRHPSGIELSNPQEDALRRDFTINGIFYDPLNNKIYDYVAGQEDINRKVIRTIGNPALRFSEDRLRMLRAFRFAARLDFLIHPDTLQAIAENAATLFPSVAIERVWQELSKMATYPRFAQALLAMHETNLLSQIFPELKETQCHELKKSVENFEKFPLHCPPILYFLELFKELSLEKKIALGKRLKVKNSDLKLIELMHQITQAIEQKDENLQKWTHLLAHPCSNLLLKVYQTRLEKNANEEFKLTMQKKIKFLQPHIELVQVNKAVITAAHLQEAGVKPGKKMGILLKEAEKIAIHRNWLTPAPILTELKASALWNCDL